MVWTLLNIQHLIEKENRALHFVLKLHFQVCAAISVRRAKAHWENPALNWMMTCLFRYYLLRIFFRSPKYCSSSTEHTAISGSPWRGSALSKMWGESSSSPRLEQHIKIWASRKRHESKSNSWTCWLQASLWVAQLEKFGLAVPWFSCLCSCRFFGFWVFCWYF